MGGYAGGFLKGLSGGGQSSGDDSTQKDVPEGGIIRKVGQIIQKHRKKSPNQAGGTDSPPPTGGEADPVNAKRGAKRVKRGGWMRVHRGERVLTRKQAKNYQKQRRKKA